MSTLTTKGGYLVAGDRIGHCGGVAGSLAGNPLVCQKHGCKLVLREISVGWGTKEIFVCPKCQKEKGH